MKITREPGRGGFLKGLLKFVFGVIVLAVLAVLGLGLYADRTIVAATSTPISMPPAPDLAKAQTTFDAKVKDASAALQKHKTATIAIDSDEANLKLKTALPPELAGSVQVVIKDGIAEVRAPIKGADFAKHVPEDMSWLRTLAQRLQYVNMVGKFAFSYSNGKFDIRVKEISGPISVPADKAQMILDLALKRRRERPVKLHLGKTEVQATSIELKDDKAIFQVKDWPPGL